MPLFVITGPPTAGKSTWVRQHAKPADIVIDYDQIVAALTPVTEQPFDAPMHIVDVAQAARRAAIHVALTRVLHCDVYIIDSLPSTEARAQYDMWSPQYVELDPGRDVCAARAATERHPRIQHAVDAWYASKANALAQR